ADCHYFQKVTCVDLVNTILPNCDQAGALLLGFASDEGVKRNHGRPGAQQGPQTIRQALAPLAWTLPAFTLLDGGNIALHDTDLATAQQTLAQYVALGLGQKLLSVVIGGGHELAWGHYQGIRHVHPNSRLGVINFDAHFDLRQPTSSQQATSGTSFWQMAQDCQQQQLPWHYFCLGIQPASNTSDLFEQAQQLNVHYCTAQQLSTMPSITYQLLQFIANTDHIYLSVCLDVFAQAFAPGVSAPQPLGITPKQLRPLLTLIFNSRKVIACDIAELSPPWDVDGRTAKLAAFLIDDCLRQFASIGAG
nr:formimidoylglutamase [Legionellales bacterium]